MFQQAYNEPVFNNSNTIYRSESINCVYYMAGSASGQDESNPAL